MSKMLHTQSGMQTVDIYQSDTLFDQSEIESKLIKTHQNTDSILQTAAPLINYISFISTQDHQKKKSEVEASLCHEMNYLEQMLRKNYRNEVVLASLHILCSWSHEQIRCSSWGKKRKWQAPTHIFHSQNETWEGENFFEIIRRSSAKPDEYKELLELCFCCMALGYQGRYRSEEQGHLICYTIIDKLWELISHDAQTPSHLKTPQAAYTTTPKRKKIRYALIVFTSALLLYSSWLSHQRMQAMEPILNTLQHQFDTPINQAFIPKVLP